MTTKPGSPTAQTTGPLRGFDFTRAWLDGNAIVRDRLPAVDELLDKRLTFLEATPWQPWSETEIQELRDFNNQGGNDTGAPLADLLGKPETLVVVTGQQPDFLASPLYVLYKALSAVAWAQKLSSTLSRPVVPIFWVASDDDDFAELKKAWILAWSGELSDVGSRLSRGDEAAAGSPAFLWNLQESTPRLHEDITGMLGGWPDGSITSRYLLEIIHSEPNFERCFCRLLSALLGPGHPMLFLAPRLNSMRLRGTSILQADLTKHATLNHAISAAADDFQDAGFPVALTRDSEALNFFWYDNGRRHRLLRTADDVITAIDPASHTEVRAFSTRELSQLLDQHPDKFIPNVVTRPVIQDTALPTAAYVAGPGEMAYLALLDTAYAAYGVARSAVVPRSFISIDVSSPRGGASPAQGIAEDKAQDFLESSTETGRALAEQVSALMTDVSIHFDQMMATAAGQTPEVALAVEKTRRHFQWGSEQLKRRLARQLAPEQWQRAARQSTAESPGGSSQERVLAPWNFVKPGDWDALAHHLTTHVDFTHAGPHIVPLPPWLKDAF